jgi:hypothetical protein
MSYCTVVLRDRNATRGGRRRRRRGLEREGGQRFCQEGRGEGGAIRWTWVDEERLEVMALFRVTVSMLVQRQLSQRMRMKGSGSGLVWEG